jgi:hypothetical protein
MMKRLAYVMVTAAALAGVLVTVPTRAENPAGKKTAAEEQAEGIKELVTAAEVARYGREQGAPEALITAAGMLLKVDGEMKIGRLEAEVEDEKGNKVKDADEKGRSLADQAQDLFDTALAMPGAAKLNLGAMIKAAKARAELIKAAKADDERKGRAPVGGPKRLSGSLSAGARRNYTIHYEPNRLAAIALTSSTPVRLEVIQPGVGILLSSVLTNAHYTWVPKGRGPVPIRVQITGTGSSAKFMIYAN